MQISDFKYLLLWKEGEKSNGDKQIGKKQKWREGSIRPVHVSQSRSLGGGAGEKADFSIVSLTERKKHQAVSQVLPRDKLK